MMAATEASGMPKIEQSRGERKKDEGHVVDVETGDEPGKGTEHHAKEQGAQ